MFTEVLPSRIKAERENLGLSQIEVAETLKIARSTLANYETGTRKPDLETLTKIAILYETSTDYLLGLSTQGNVFNITHKSKKHAKKN
jgi:transcriptional regulator with XRE-family HTH domain